MTNLLAEIDNGGLPLIGTFSWFLSFFCFAFIVLFFYSLTKKRNGLSTLFACVCLTISVYIGGYVLELHGDDLKDISFALKAQYFGAPFMSAFWLLLSYKFRYRKSASPKLTMLFVAIPLITLFLSVTNDYHHLLYTRISAFIHDGYLLSNLESGPWYYVNIVYAYAVQLFSMVVFFKAWQEKNYRTDSQAFWLLFGSVWPGLANLLYVAGHSPLQLDPTTFGLSISAIFFCVAIFRYGFLDLQEIVKDVIFFEIDEGILIINERNRLIDYNKACKGIFSWLEPSLIGTDIRNFSDLQRILDQPASIFELVYPQEDSYHYFEFRKTPLTEKETSLGTIYFIRDITKQKEMIQDLHDIAYYDSLTEIYNRRRLMEHAERELRYMLRYGTSLSFLMIDIDHFKKVNDRYGHQAGDIVLKELAITCMDRIRQTDTIGRYGGEEFLIILPETNANQAMAIAESIRTSIENMKFHSAGHEIRITVSIGIKTSYSGDADLTVDEMIRQADLALYHAKKNGRNQTSISTE